jgi:hypothetical protein
MAVALTKIAGYSDGNKRVRIYDAVFSGNYATGGEALSARTLGFKKVEMVEFSGAAVSTDVATANPVAYDFTNSKVLFYEGAGSGAAIGEKTDAEAYPTGSHVRIKATGYGGIS